MASNGTSDILKNKNNTLGARVGAECQGNLVIARGYMCMLPDIATGTYYGIYMENGDLKSVQLDENFNPVV